MVLGYGHTFLADLAILLGVGRKGDVFLLLGGVGYHGMLYGLSSMHTYGGAFNNELATFRTNTVAEASQAGRVNR